jgi:hypothetical protein
MIVPFPTPMNRAVWIDAQAGELFRGAPPLRCHDDFGGTAEKLGAFVLTRIAAGIIAALTP